MPQLGSKKTRVAQLRAAIREGNQDELAVLTQDFLDAASDHDAAFEGDRRLLAFVDADAAQLIAGQCFRRGAGVAPATDRCAETFGVIIAAVPGEFLLREGERARASGAQINRRAIFIREHFGDDAAHLETGGILTGGGVLAGDRFVDAFESADAESHSAGEFFEHIGEVLEIAADEELRLLRGDVEGGVGRLDRIPDLLHVRLKAGDGFADR